MNVERQTQPKRLTRRGFLTALGFTVGALSLGKSSWIEASPRGEPEDYFPPLNRATILYPTKNSQQAETWQIDANPRAFFDALEYIAWREQGKAGLTKLSLFLEQNSIPVEFVDVLPGGGQYIPSVWILEPRGPRIRYLTTYGENLTTVPKYIDVERRADMAGRRVYDHYLGYHEVFHVWQEIRNPLSFAFALINMSEKHPFEKEARIKSWEIMSERNKLGRLDQFFIPTRIK